MAKKTRSYRNALLESLADPAEAAHYLNAAIEDSSESFLKALKNVARARQMAKVAKDAGVQRETLYRAFSGQGNPTLETLSSVLRAVGLKISIDVESEQTPPVLNTARPNNSFQTVSPLGEVGNLVTILCLRLQGATNIGRVVAIQTATTRISARAQRL